jgi:hypothetical protein
VRNITEIQRKLIALGYPVGPAGADGKFGHDTLDAYNRFRASKGNGPVLKASMDELNADLFPEDAPPLPKSTPRNPLKDWLIDLAIKQAVSRIKGLPQMDFLSGYKTYILAVLILLSSAAETLIPGLDIPGYSMGLGEAIMVALALVTGRGGAKADVNKALGK